MLLEPDFAILGRSQDSSFTQFPVTSAGLSLHIDQTLMKVVSTFSSVTQHVIKKVSGQAFKQFLESEFTRTTTFLVIILDFVSYK